jgi:ribosomal protein S18 acetylase RimI-like enzyme
MITVVRAEGAVLETILDDTHALWHDGLTRVRYGDYNRAQTVTEWGAANLARVALVDGSRVLASAKRYHLVLDLSGRAVPTLGIGAVFTPPAVRRRGHARHLIETLIEEGQSAGAEGALLFSEIGTGYYERLGFTTVPLHEVDIDVDRRAGAPAVLVRSGEAGDLAFVADIHTQRAAGYRLSLRYDESWLQYSLAKKRILAAFAPTGHRAMEFFVAEEGTRAVAWVLLSVTGRDRRGLRESWSLESSGDRDPSGARVGAILQALIARTPAAPPPLIRGWWPAGLEPVQLRFARRPAPTITMMLRPLSDAVAAHLPVHASDVLFWHGDAF